MRGRQVASVDLLSVGLQSVNRQRENRAKPDCVCVCVCERERERERGESRHETNLLAWVFGFAGVVHA